MKTAKMRKMTRKITRRMMAKALILIWAILVLSKEAQEYP